MGAHLGGVDGFGDEAVQGERVRVGLDEVRVVVVQHDLPCRGLAVFRPTEGGGGGTKGVDSQQGGTLTPWQLFHAQADAVFLVCRIDGIAGRSRRVVVVVAIAI